MQSFHQISESRGTRSLQVCDQCASEILYLKPLLGTSAACAGIKARQLIFTQINTLGFRLVEALSDFPRRFPCITGTISDIDRIVKI